jgi:hypothetical protein
MASYAADLTLFGADVRGVAKAMGLSKGGIEEMTEQQVGQAHGYIKEGDTSPPSLDASSVERPLSSVWVHNTL